MVFAAWNATEPRTDFRYKSLGSRAVIFPGQSNLKVTASTDRTTYKPGAKVPLRIQVASSEGKPVEAALGLAVVDQAVLERARTDSEFGHRSWFTCLFCIDSGETGIGDVRLNDLYALKPADSITPELDLVAEALVAGESGPIFSADSESLLDTPMFAGVKAQIAQMTAALDRHYASSLEIPESLSDWSRILGRTWTDAMDPWGKPYSAMFSISRDDRVVTLVSSGPDKMKGTADDFIAGTFRRSYVAPLESLLKDLLKKQEDYPATSVQFNRLLCNNGFNPDTLRDAWGTPYHVKVETVRLNRTITLESAGPDRQFETGDDFQALSLSGSYFQHEGNVIAAALRKSPEVPQDNDAFRRLAAGVGIDITSFRDDWNRPYRLTNAISSRYSDRFSATTVRVFGGPPREATDVVPVTQRFITFSLRSAGADGVDGTFDDFTIASFPLLLKEESASPAQSVANPRGTGTIAGTVVDASGAIIAAVSVTLTDATGIVNQTVTDELGQFTFASLPPGEYSLESTASGFKIYRLLQVPVTEGKVTDVDIVLSVGQFTDSVTVTAEATVLQTESASISSTGPNATPRVREYFPETLLWIPELVTDAGGAARTSIPLADSVTNWKIAVIASTLDGRIAETESDLRTFQPFFVDFDAPQVLTEGDQIEVPVTVRNYQKTAKKIAVTWIADTGLALKNGTPARQISAPPDGSARTSYVIQAEGTMEKVQQRVTAIAGRSRDAIVRPSRVHPDGQEIVQNFGDLVVGDTAFTVAIPPTSIPSATRGELRVYPNIASLLLESASAIMVAPHGCAEQTISAGYANLVAWRFARTAGIVDPKLERKAVANVRLALDGLLGFMDYEGGVRYWSTGTPDVAVTAHALSFLVEAGDLVPVDPERIQGIIRWLEMHQGKDGRWLSDGGVAYAIRSNLADRQALLLTGIVTKSLAAAKRAGEKISPAVLAAAYHHLAQFTDQTDEPYMLATFILAALDSGDEGLLGNAITRLLNIGRAERDGLYWDLQTNSPFFGWGTAGRYETTGLVVSALSAWKVKHSSLELDSTVRRGLLFLLRGRDATGGWSSTQSTLRAMRAVADASQSLGNFGGQGGAIEVRSNGRLIKAIALPRDPKASDAILLDLSAFLSPGDNQITLTPSAGAQSAMMHFSGTHWVPWEKAAIRTSPELRLAVEFDNLEAQVGQSIRCSVKAERIGFHGYGMMLAEIGLPPGAEVDRASLESVLDNPVLGVDHYEVLPDRVLLYLWPKAGGSNFDFTMSARLPMIAKSGVSTLYDYYNPDAMAEVMPSRWVVH